ncbi:MAG: hypothetical protein JSV02_08195 [Dehalococcoidia bacterium]|nr:MAG: hypothetical protein JSV02_08195 [Dehalococcoidia bacterium]
MSRKYLVLRCLASILSIVVALAVATPGVAIMVWIIDRGRFNEPVLAALVLFLFGIAALVAAPNGLYRNAGVRWAALLCSILLMCTAVVAFDMALLGMAMEYVYPGLFPWQLATLILVTELSAAVILIGKVRSGQEAEFDPACQQRLADVVGNRYLH